MAAVHSTGIIKKHLEAFSLRDKIGNCPNIEAEIDVTERSHTF